MYENVLALHNLLRWAVVLALGWAALRATSGWLAARPWRPADRAAGRWLAIALDVQLVVGLVLYGALSPLTRKAMGDMGAAMADPGTRFFAVDHAVGGILAVAIVHGAQVMARKVGRDVGKHRLLAIVYGVVIALLVFSVPWPWMGQARPWFRMPLAG